MVSKACHSDLENLRGKRILAIHQMNGKIASLIVWALGSVVERVPDKNEVDGPIPSVPTRNHYPPWTSPVIFVKLRRP